jgi:hypothetical protein
MADSDLSASELRQRYHRGGTARDDELSAKQLRARHAIPSNKGDFSTSQKDGATGFSPMIIIVVLAVLAVSGFFVFFSSNKK